MSATGYEEFVASPPTPEETAQLFEDMKYAAARHIYKTRTAEQLTPSSHRTTSNKKKINWAQWFEQRFGENFYDYVKRKTEDKKNGKSQEEGG